MSYCASPVQAQAPNGTDTNEGLLSQYVLPIYVPSLSPVTSSSLGFNPCSCVSFVRYKRPDQNTPWGTPDKVEAYDITPLKGLILLTTEGPVGHAAYVTSVSADFLTVQEANYKPCSVTTREIPRSADYIRGYR